VLTAVLVANALLPILTYIIFPAAAERRGWLRAHLRDIPYRNEYQHFFQPWRMLDDSPTRLGRAALEAAGPNGWIIADSTTFSSLVLLQILDQQPSSRRIYLLDRCMDDLRVPHLTNATLRAEVARGRRVIAIPGVEPARFAGDLTIRPHGNFWLIAPAAASGPAEPVATTGSTFAPNP
jgi:hypothetical protein